MLLLCSSTSCSNTTPVDPIKKYGLTMDYKDNFKILWLTDLHYGQNALLTKQAQFDHLKKMIDESDKPDLIVLTGDTFWEESLSDVDDYLDYLDSFNLKWTFVYGNHDMEPFKDLGDDYLINEKIMAHKNQVYIDYENDKINGLNNFYINLVQDKKTIYRLYMIDSNADNPDGDGYDVIHFDQLSHVQKISKAENDNASGLAFYHIPITQYVDAYTRYQKGELQGKGENRESCCVGYTDTGAYSLFESVGVIGSFCGHDHSNDSDIFYKADSNDKGMILSYGLKSSDQCYYESDMIGYKTITLPSDPSKFTLDSIQTHFCLYD